MPDGENGHFFLVTADQKQRRLVVAAVEAKLRALKLLRPGMRVAVKKSLHLYVFDDHGLITPGGGFVDNAVARRNVLALAREIELALADLFKRDLPGCPSFLWRYLKVSPLALPGSTMGLHIVSAKLVTSDAVDHWYVSYELKMQTPDGEMNGIHGAIMEMRFQPQRGGSLHLILLHIRFPLMGYYLPTRFHGIALPEVDIAVPRDEPGAHDHSMPKPHLPLQIPVTPPPSHDILPLKIPDIETRVLPDRLITLAAPDNGKVPPVKPRLAFALPVEGSNVLAPQMLLGSGETLRHFPVTPDSTRLMIDHRRQGGMDILTAHPFPATYDDWHYVWHIAEISSTQRSNPDGRIVTGKDLVLPRGSYQIDLLAQRRYALPGNAGLSIDATIRARRTLWATMEMAEVDGAAAQQILAGHHHGDDPGAGGDDAHGGHA